MIEAVDSTSKKADNRWDRFAPWIILFAVWMFCLPIFIKMDGFASVDSKRQARALGTLNEIEFARMGIVEFGQAALWSPYCDGGYPSIKSPSNLAFSPLIIPTLIFGSIVGLKILIIFATWIGAWGVFLLARKICELGTIGAYFSALSFAFSGWLPCLALEGEPNVLLMMSPIIIYLVLSADGSPRKLAGAGLILGLLLLSGPHLVLPLLYFLILLSALYALNRFHAEDKSLLWVNLIAFALLIIISLPLMLHELVTTWIRVFVAVGFAAYLFELPITRNLIRPCAPAVAAAVIVIAIAMGVGYGRIASSINLMQDAEAYRLIAEGPPEAREVEENRPDEFYSLANLSKSLFNVKPTRQVPDRLQSAYGHLGITWPIIICFGIGAFVYRRRFASLLTALCIVTLICLGPSLPLDFHQLFIRGIPFFDLITDSYKHFSFFIAFFIVLISGGAVDWIYCMTEKRQWEVVITLGVLALLLFPFIGNRSIYRSAYEVSFPKIERSSVFHSVAPAPAEILEREGWPIEAAYKRIFQRRRKDAIFASEDRHRYTNLDPMLNLRRQVGTMDYPRHFPLAMKTEPRFWVMPDDNLKPYQHYRGEAYFYEMQNKVLSFQIAGNTLLYEVDVKQGGLLTVNQNYNPDFKVHPGKLTESGGKLAVLLPEPGRYTVKFVYRPVGVILRFILSGILCLALIAFCASPLLRKLLPTPRNK